MLKITPISQHLRELNFALDTKRFHEFKKTKKDFPQAQVAINTSYRDFGDSEYEVTVSVVCESGDEGFFNIVCEYSGIFKIEGSQSNETLITVISGYCTGFVFPFIRAKIASVTVEAGLQAIMLSLLIFMHYIKIKI